MRILSKTVFSSFIVASGTVKRPGFVRLTISRNIVKTLENRYPIFKAGEAAGTSMCRVLSMKSTVRPFHGPWGAYAPQG